MYGLFLFENDGLLLASTYPSLQLMNDRLAKPQSPHLFIDSLTVFVIIICKRRIRL